jgi:hypothetical protein
MKTRRLIVLGFLLILAVPLACHEPEPEEIEVDLDMKDGQVTMPPAGEFVLEGDTIVLTIHDTAPMIHSWPSYAGVPDSGDAGLGTAVNYKPGQRITIPLNVNIGDSLLSGYTIRLTVEEPEVLQIEDVDGSNPLLNEYYPEQYNPATDFESISQISIGDTVTTVSTGPVETPATGRFNLLNLLVDIKKETPEGGTPIYLELISFTDPGGEDACPLDGCTIYNSLFIKEFILR